MPSEADAGVCCPWDRTLPSPALWRTAYRGLDCFPSSPLLLSLPSFISSLRNSFSQLKGAPNGQCWGRKVWPRGLDFRQIWRAIQLQSFLWDWQVFHATALWFTSSLFPALLPFFCIADVLPLQKRIGTVVWGAVLRTPVWKYGPWLAPGNLGLFHSQNWQEQLIVPKLVVEAMWSILDTYFPVGSPEFWCVLSQEYLRDQHPIKPWALSLCWVSWQAHCMWVASQVLRDSTGRRFLEACARFPPGFVPGTFCLLLIFLYNLWIIISVSATIYQPLLFLLANYQTPPNSCIQISIILVNLTEVTLPLLLTQDLLFLEAQFQAMVPQCFQFPNLIILESKHSHLAG